jgi:ATP-binding cassette, subfamily B, multidrug efflux pump
MSTTKPAPTAARGAGPQMRGPMGGMMGPPQKAKNFRGSARRLVGLLGPQKPLVIIVIACAVIAVGFSVSGPKILGRGTDIIFAGFFGSRLPANLTHDQAVAHLRASGNSRTADLVDAMHVVPGHGIDFDALAHVLGLVLLLYLGASLFMWLQGYILNHVVQRTVKKLRTDVDAKLMRVPLAYFDRQQHG